MSTDNHLVGGGIVSGRGERHGLDFGPSGFPRHGTRTTPAGAGGHGRRNPEDRHRHGGGVRHRSGPRGTAARPAQAEPVTTALRRFAERSVRRRKPRCGAPGSGSPDCSRRTKPSGTDGDGKTRRRRSGDRTVNAPADAGGRTAARRPADRPAARARRGPARPRRPREPAATGSRRPTTGSSSSRTTRTSSNTGPRRATTDGRRAHGRPARREPLMPRPPGGKPDPAPAGRRRRSDRLSRGGTERLAAVLPCSCTRAVSACLATAFVDPPCEYPGVGGRGGSGVGVHAASPAGSGSGSAAVSPLMMA